MAIIHLYQEWSVVGTFYDGGADRKQANFNFVQKGFGGLCEEVGVSCVLEDLCRFRRALNNHIFSLFGLSLPSCYYLCFDTLVETLLRA